MAKRFPLVKPVKTAELLNQRLELVHRWYQGMVHPLTGMLEYTYIPQTNRYIRKKCPIRDIGAVWNVEMLERFLNKQETLPLIEKSQAHYDGYLIEREGYLILDPYRMNEPSSIAHSAFMMLALLNSPPPRRIQRIAALADGILRQQRPNGSYNIYFDNLALDGLHPQPLMPDEGEELYAGAAMLALLEAYGQYPDIRYLPSVERGIAYYDGQYFQPGLVTHDALVFFANWQTQASRRLFDYAPSDMIKQDVLDYVCRMHDRISDQGFYRGVKHRPASQVSVVVACALEGLNDAYALTRASNDERFERYQENICVGIDYLTKVQCTNTIAKKERGGFGLALNDRSQRIDVTGHAAKAFMKTVENGIEC